MQTATVQNRPDLATPAELKAENPWLEDNPTRLRYLLSKRDENGLSSAVVRIGRVLLIDRDKWARWLDSQRESAA